MRRHLFNLAAAVSLVLCVVIVHLWISTWGDVKLSMQIGWLHVLLVNGEAEFAWGTYWGTTSQFITGSLALIADACPLHLMGFGADAGPPLRCVVPLWSLTVATAMLPIAWLVNRHRRTTAISANLCPTCGYDCRGPAAGTLLERCPECGTDVITGG